MAMKIYSFLGCPLHEKCSTIICSISKMNTINEPMKKYKNKALLNKMKIITIENNVSRKKN